MGRVSQQNLAHPSITVAIHKVIVTNLAALRARYTKPNEIGAIHRAIRELIDADAIPARSLMDEPSRKDL